MPTKKQRRRREKGRRHEYEYVYVDEEGREVEVDEAEREPETPAKAPAKAGRRAAPREPRGVQPPSWRRVGKRTLLFAPLMFVVITLLDPELTVIQRLIFAAQMVALFVPFSYLMDTMTYRMWRRRLARTGAESGSRRR